MGMRLKVGCGICVLWGAMFWGTGASFGAEAKTFLAVEVQVQGDAGSWRWWCGGSDDPLIIKAWRGFWKGLDEEADVRVVSQLKGNEVDVHPMYCKDELDEPTARNLAGLFGAEQLRVGRLEISKIESHQDPGIYSAVLRYRGAVMQSGDQSGSQSSKDSETEAKPLWAERNVTVNQAVDIPSGIESGARDLAHQVRQLSVQSLMAARRLRAQIFVVKNMSHRGADSWLIRRLAGVLPQGVRLDAEGFRAGNGLFRISAPRSNRGDLIDLLRESLTKDGGSTFLVFEGTSLEGLPVFQAVGAPIPPWAPRPEPLPEPQSDDDGEDPE